MDHFKKDLMMFLGFFILLFVAWLITGGPERAHQTGSSSDKFIKPLEPINSGQTYDESLKDLSPVKINVIGGSGVTTGNNSGNTNTGSNSNNGASEYSGGVY